MYSVRGKAAEQFGEFTREESHAVLISSHIVSDLEKICDYIAFLHQGRLLLCEEKDVLLEEYGVLRCTAGQLSELNPSAILGKRESPYGVEAIVRRDAVPGMAAVFLLLGLIGPATTLPFMFRFGAEKGRIAYFAVIILLCGGSAAFGSIQVPGGENIPGAGAFMPQAGVSLLMAVLALLIYAVSWKLSIVFYEKKEL